MPSTPAPAPTQTIVSADTGYPLLVDRVSEVRIEQRVLAEAFNRHEVSNEKAFHNLQEGLEHAHDCTHRVGAESTERDQLSAANFKDAINEVKKELDAARHDIAELKMFMYRLSAGGAVVLFIFLNFTKIVRLVTGG